MLTSAGRILRIQLPLWFILPLLLLSIFIGSGIGYLSALQLTTPCTMDKATCLQFQTFWHAWQLASRNYVDPKAIDPTKMTDGAIGGMIDSLGDLGHSRYLAPDVAKAEREAITGKFEGIGAYIDIRDGQPLITEPMEGSPAQKAGLLPNDKIIRVDSHDVRGSTIDQLRNMVRGPRGTKVTLTIQRDGREAPFDVVVTREEINVPSVTWRMIPGNVAYIQLSQFSSQASEQLHDALAEAKSKGATSAVLDLRNNPGGLVDQLINVASEFLPKGTTILIERDRDGKEIPYTARSGGSALDLPMVVLVNANSASAAEILAGALSETKRAKVIGVPTFGTATVLRTFALENGGELRLGTSQWLTPKGEMVRGLGIKPDTIVELPAGKSALTPAAAAKLDLPGLKASGDAQLIRALDLLGATSGG